jgi:hypothetical protein
MKKTQMNVPVEDGIKKLISSDCAKFRKSKENLVGAILSSFFALKASEREKLYARIPSKIFGRPVCS